MKLVSLIKYLAVCMLICILTQSLFSQVVVERSKEKVVISGVPYYLHTVKKGETPYSISKAYGITPEELAKDNPSALYGVKVDEKLKIPVKELAEKNTSEKEPQSAPHDDSKFIYHKMKPGETVYSISKSYGVSDSEIAAANPGKDINKLAVGAEIAIPRREFMSDRKKFDDNKKKYFFHKVITGESLSSIAEKYGLTVKELRKVNKDLRFPQVGDFVKIPGVQEVVVNVPEPVKNDTVKIVEEVIPVVKAEKPVGYTKVSDLRGTLNVAVLLPFYLKENSVRTEIDSSKLLKGKKVYKTVRRPDDWIYPGTDFVEMYEGILLAADTLRALGLNINISPYDITEDTVEITNLINSGKLLNADIIIGPVYSNVLNIVARFAREKNIPVVSPVSLINNSCLKNNPTLFMAGSSLEIAQSAIAKKISESYDNNLIFIHADSLGVDEDVKRFKNKIFAELTNKLPYDEIKFREFLYYSRSMFDLDSINRLSHALSEQSKNLVIIASEDAPVINETIDGIYSLSKKYDVKVIGYPIIRELENIEQKELFDLDMVMYTSSWIDYSQADVKQFNSDFRQKFLTEPNDRSYAWQGYDITYYFLSGLALNGKDFLKNPSNHNPDLLQTEYNFVRKDDNSGFENQKLFVIRYTKEYNVELQKDQ
jgi:LysM repeat protein